MHVAPIRRKTAFSRFTDNLLWHTLTTILFLFEKLVWIPEHNDSYQFILCLSLNFSDLEPLGLNISVTTYFCHPRVLNSSRFT